MKLYRYRNVNINTYHELLHNEIWYSKYSELNDPFEGMYINNSNAGDFDFLVATLRVCCFSKRDNSLLLWAHYADAHRGICLEYEVEDTVYATQFFDVTYSNSLPILEKIDRYPKGHPVEGKLSMHIDKEGAIFRNKSDDWSYEEECRTLRISEHPGSKGESATFPGKLTGIRFGLRSLPSTVKAIHKILSARSDVMFQKAKLRNNKYELYFESVDRSLL